MNEEMEAEKAYTEALERDQEKTIQELLAKMSALQISVNSKNDLV